MFEKPLPEATQDIRDAISGIRNDLPTEMEEPIIRKFSADRHSDRVAGALLGGAHRRPSSPGWPTPASPASCARFAGVAEVTVSGKREREMTVELRPEALQSSGVSVAQVVQAVQLQNMAAPVGRLEGQLEERSIRLRGRLDEPRGIRGAGGVGAEWPADPARRCGGREGRRRGAAHPGALQRQGGGRHRPQEGQGIQHHRRVAERVLARIEKCGRRSPPA